MKRIQINWSQMSTASRIGLVSSIVGIIFAPLTIYQCFHSSSRSAMQINAPNSGTQYLIQQPQNCQFVTEPEQDHLYQEMTKNLLQQVSDLKKQNDRLNTAIIKLTGSATKAVFVQEQEITKLRQSAESHFKNHDFQNSLVDFGKALAIIKMMADNKDQVGVQYEINPEAVALLNIEMALTALGSKQFDIMQSNVAASFSALRTIQQPIEPKNNLLLLYTTSLAIIYESEMANFYDHENKIYEALTHAELAINIYERARLTYGDTFEKLSINSEPEYLYALAAWIANRAMRPEQALVRAEQSLRIKWSSSATRSKAIAMFNLGHADEALNFLKAVLTEHSDDQKIREFQATFLQATRSLTNGVIAGIPPSNCLDLPDISTQPIGSSALLRFRMGGSNKWERVGKE